MQNRVLDITHSRRRVGELGRFVASATAFTGNYIARVAKNISWKRYRALKPKQQILVAVVFFASIIALNLLWIMSGNALSQGPKMATASADCVNNTGTGTAAWTTPGEAFSDNATYASVAVDGTASNYIYCTNFGFSIPTGATINGVVMSVERKASGTLNGGTADSQIRLVHGGAVGATNKATTTVYPTTDTAVSYGSSTDLWGATLTPTDINAANFGAAVAVTKANGAGAALTVTVDVVTLRVYYTLPPTNSSQNSYRVFDNVDTGSATTFVKSYGGVSGERGNSVVQTTDGGYAITGYTGSYGAGGDDMFLAKYDSAGNLSFSRTWGGTGADYGQSIVQTTDGGYAVTGETASFGTGGGDMFLAKYDSAGTLSFSRTWGGTGGERGESIVQTADGGYAVTGYTGSYGAGGNDMFLAKYDSAGTLSFSRTWGGTGTDYGLSLVQLSDGGYAVTGHTGSYGAGADDMFLAKYDSAGTLSFSRTWGGTGADYGRSLVQTTDGGYAITGYTGSYGAGGIDMFLAKYDSAGTLSFSQTWGGTGGDFGLSLVHTSDGGYAINGYTDGYGAGGIDVLLVKYDSAGTLSFSRTWGSSGNDVGRYLIQTTDGGYAITSYTNSYGAGDIDMFLAKYDSAGNITGCSNTNCQAPIPTTASPTVATSSPTATTASPTVTTSSPTATTSKDNDDYTSIKTTIVALNPSGIDVGSPLAAQNTAATAPASGIFRMRMDLAISNFELTPGITSFKLQYAKKSGSCDTGFVGETFADVTTSTPISYLDNPNAGNGLPLTVNANDPTDGTNTLVRQGYQEASSGSFTATSTVPVGQSAMWDFGLKIGQGTFGSESYCLRMVDGSGSALSAYTIVPEIITPPSSISQAGARVYEAPGEVSFVKTMGGTVFDSSTSLVQTSDGGYAITGFTRSFSAGGEDMFLSKYDSVGSLSYTRTWGGTGNERGNSLVQTSDGGYAITGYTISFSAGNEDMFLVKYDSAGTLSFSRTWGGTGTDYGKSLIQTSDGGYAITGSTNSFGAGGNDMFLAKYDSAGTLSFSRTWGATNSEGGDSIVQTSDGGYAITGSTTNFGAGGNDMFLAKYDSAGTLSFSRTWGGTGTDYGKSLIQTSDGGYAVTGYTDGFGAGLEDMFLAKYDSAGTLSFSRTWGGSTSNERGSSLIQTSDGGYAVTGETNSFGAGSYDMFLTKYDSAGTLSFSRTWGGTGIEVGYSLNQTTDGGYAVTGSTNSFGAGSTDMFLAKYDSAGNIAGCNSANCQTPTPSTSNPSATTTTPTPTTSSPTATTASPTVTVTLPNPTQTTVVAVSGSATAFTFNKAFGGTGNDYSNSLVQTSDGGYAVTGSTYSFSAGGDDMFLAKYDSAGTLSFSRTWGGTSFDGGDSLVQTSDGGYAVTGSTDSFGAGGGDMFLAKYDSTGTLSFSRTWGGTGGDGGKSLVQTSDGGYAITGNTESYGTGALDMFLAKYDSAGTLSFSRTWGNGSTGIHSGDSLVQTSDGGYAITGGTDSAGAGIGDMFLAKYDSAGTLSFSRTWGGTSNDDGISLAQTSDGGYAITGRTDSFGAGGSDMFLAKYNSAGTLSFSRTWGGTGDESGSSLVQTSDGGYAITGRVNSFSNGIADLFLAKYNSAGNLSFSRTWGGTGSDVGISLVQTSDGGYAVTGNTNSFGAGSNDMFLAKYDSAGSIADCSNTNCKSPTAVTSSPSASTSSPTVTTASPTATIGSPAATISSDGLNYTSVKTNIVSSVALAAVGAPYDGQNKALNLGSLSTSFRVRMNIGISSVSLAPATAFKLQYATRGSDNKCDVSFTGETYTDVTTATAIRFHDDRRYASGGGLHTVTGSNDVTDSSNLILRQQFVEANNFSSNTPILIGQSGQWDFSLIVAPGTSVGSAFCLRIITGAGATLSSYAFVPEIQYGPATNQRLRNGRYFDSNYLLQPFFLGR